MHAYIRLFFTLFLPLSLLFTVASIGYFTFNYDFSKAIQLGVLAGVLIGLAVSFVLAFVLLILRKVQKVESTQSDHHTETQTAPIQEVAKEHKNSKNNQAKGVSKEVKCMLLMDRELTFEVLLNTLKDQDMCTVSASDPKKGTLTIQTKEGMIQTTITSLTKHTSQIILLTQNNAKHVKTLISLIKEKEHAFLQY